MKRFTTTLKNLSLGHNTPLNGARGVLIPVASNQPPTAPDDAQTAPSLLSNTVRVHLDYDMNSPPPHPGDEWTRFVCLSDTHSHEFVVPPGDVLLHSGDLTGYGRVNDFRTTMEWLRELPHPTKIIIAGNHDLALHEEWYKEKGLAFHDDYEDVDAARELVMGQASRDASIVYLEDESYEFRAKYGGRTWSVYGCPWTPYFGGWGFNYRPEDTPKLISVIPKTDILLTHGPPLQVHDLTTRDVHAGCPALLERVSQIQPRLHVFGHIHEGRGATLRKWDDEAVAVADGMPLGGESDTLSRMTTFVNAANMPMPKGPRNWEKRQLPGSPGWQPIIVDLLDAV